MNRDNRISSTTRRRLAGPALLLLLGPITGCNPFAPGPGLAPMAVEPRGGRIIVAREGDRLTVTGRFDLEPGDVIETRSSSARLHLEGDRYATLAPATEVILVDGSTLEEVAGAVVAEASQPVSVVLDDAEATIRGGTIRIERDNASASVAVLGGAAALRAPGQLTVDVGRLFEVSVAAGEVLEPRPYQVDDEDAWDRRYLSPVVALELQLQRYSRALEAQTEGKRLQDSFISVLAGEEGVGLLRPYLSKETPTTDLIIGSSIATLDDSRSREESLSRAFDLRDRGGQWGVVASLMGVEVGPLLALLEHLGSSLLRVAEGGASGIRFEPPDGTRGSPGRGGQDDATGLGHEAAGNEGHPGPREPVVSCDNVVDCTLHGPPPLPSPETQSERLP